MTVSIPNSSLMLSCVESSTQPSGSNGSKVSALDSHVNCQDREPSSQEHPVASLFPPATTSQQQPQQQQPLEQLLGSNSVPVLCIELIGDRFLRRMVRVLVATAVREASAHPDLLPTPQQTSNHSTSRSVSHEPQGNSNGTLTSTSTEPVSETVSLSKNTLSPWEHGGTGGSSTGVVDPDPTSAVVVVDHASAMLDLVPTSAVVNLDPSSALRRYCGGLEKRLLTAPAAPALGLCFAGVGYEDGDDVVLTYNSDWSMNERPGD